MGALPFDADGLAVFFGSLSTEEARAITKRGNKEGEEKETLCSCLLLGLWRAGVQGQELGIPWPFGGCQVSGGLTGGRTLRTSPLLSASG